MSSEDAGNHGKIPVTMLSGFLGAGKTTLLKYVLENADMKVACLVNDVASINIDAKLVRNTQGRAAGQGNSQTAIADLVELQNGCVCCSAAEELFPAFEQIVSMDKKEGKQFDRIILENSGVAEPQNIRDSFADAQSVNHPLLEKIELGCLITVVDSATFIRDFSSRIPLSMRPDLGEGGSMRPVVDLLVEQIECADVVVLNKADLVDEKAMMSLPAIVASLNPLARVLSCSHGKIPTDIIKLPSLISKLNVESQHRSAVVAAKEIGFKENATGSHGHRDEHHGHDHGHHHHHHQDHGHGHDHHQHHHQHQHHGHDQHQHQHQHHGHGQHQQQHHGHGHDQHQHQHHGHDHHHHHHHGHGHDHDGHSHEHSHRQETTAAKRFGITSFVYQRRKPFHPLRLKELVLKWLPAPRNSALEGQAPPEGDRPIKKVLRSKGFLWLSNAHATAFYWSHAGQHFELREEGDWWAAVEANDWPSDPELRDVVLSDFQGALGDRRQEIVFIGANMNEDQICQQMDEALLTDNEMMIYVQNWARYPDPPHPGRSTSGM